MKIPQDILLVVNKLLSPYGVNINAALKETNAAAIEKKYFTVADAEKYSGIGRWTLARAVKAGKIRQAKLSPCRGGKVLIDKVSLDSWLEGLIYKPQKGEIDYE